MYKSDPHLLTALIKGILGILAFLVLIFGGRALLGSGDGSLSEEDTEASHLLEIKAIENRVEVLHDLASQNGPSESTIEMLKMTEKTPQEYYDRTMAMIEQIQKRADDEETKQLINELLSEAKSCQIDPDLLFRLY